MPVHEQLGARSLQTTVNPLMLITHGCEIDKAGVDVLLVCRVRELSQLDGGLPGDVRSGRVRSAMYLGQVGPLAESFADFRYMHRVLRSDLTTARAAGSCVASMTVDGRLSLQTHLYRFHTRRFPGDPVPTNPDDV